jgi:hypothetical protein
VVLFRPTGQGLKRIFRATPFRYFPDGPCCVQVAPERDRTGSVSVWRGEFIHHRSTRCLDFRRFVCYLKSDHAVESAPRGAQLRSGDDVRHRRGLECAGRLWRPVQLGGPGVLVARAGGSTGATARWQGRPGLGMEPAILATALEDELERAEMVDPRRIPSDIVTMSSEVTIRDLASDEVESIRVVFPGASAPRQSPTCERGPAEPHSVVASRHPVGHRGPPGAARTSRRSTDRGRS